MTLPPELNAYISAALFVLGAYVFAIYVGLIVWTFRDMHTRTRDVLAQILTTVLVAIFTLPGLLVYLLLRPHETLAEAYERSLAEETLLKDLDERHVCLGCGRHTEPEWIVCPHCHHQLKLRCLGCGRLLSPDWDVCPYCGIFRDQDDVTPGADDGPENLGEEQAELDWASAKTAKPQSFVADSTAKEVELEPSTELDQTMETLADDQDEIAAPNNQG